MATTFPDIPSAELCAVVRAVRAHPRRDRDLRAAVAVFGVFLAIFLHSATPAAWNPSRAQPSAHEENQMLSPRQIAVVSSLALSSAAVAQNAVQWRVEDGGNGHWYAITPSGVSFEQAAATATQLGAHLVTIHSAEEQSFVATRIANGTSFLNAWMGLRQDLNSTEPAGGWRWVTGEPLSGYTNWWIGVPQPDNNACNVGVPENFAMWAKQWGGAWADVTADAIAGAPCSGPQTHALIEWSADCNADGIVDYGQIRAGDLLDANANNIPDCCESPVDCCPGDADGSGAVNGVDLAAILNNWGTNGGKYPGADANGDGIVDATDLALVLGNWGPCN